MSTTLSFWAQTHPLSAKAEELFAQLVPDMGCCDTLQGELLRASSKIGYDWYNNGWGCNNWSGAVVFLRKHISKLPNRAQELNEQEFHGHLSEVHQYSHGESVKFIDADHTDEIVTSIHEYVVKSILANPDPIPNTLDMYQFGEPDARYYDYDDEDEDY